MRVLARRLSSGLSVDSNPRDECGIGRGHQSALAQDPLPHRHFGDTSSVSSAALATMRRARHNAPRSPQCAAIRCRRQDGGAERWPVSFWQVAAPGCERRHLLSSGQVPVPDSDTVGLPTELEIFNVADFAPAPGGLNVTPIVQVAPAASGAEQLLLTIENDGRFAPVSCQPMADSVVVPVLCTVIVCAALVVPTA